MSDLWTRYSEAFAELAKASGGLLCQLFDFTVTDVYEEDGSQAHWRYTTLEQSVVNGGETFAPAVIDVERRRSDKGASAIEPFAVKCGLIEPFLSFVGSRHLGRCTVSIWDVFWDGDQPVAALVDRGHLTTATSTAAGTTAEFVPLAAWLKKKVPAMLIGRGDQRVPYTSAFGIDESVFATPCEITNISQNIVTSPQAGERSAGWYGNGFILYDRTVSGKTVRYRVPIVTNDTADGKSDFVLEYPPPHLADDEGFTAHAGYDATRAQAVSKFNNLNPDRLTFPAALCFMGFPWLPQTNPVFNRLTPAETPGQGLVDVTDPQLDWIGEADTNNEIVEAAPGAEVWINGYYFGGTQGDGIVLFGGVSVASYVQWRNNQVRVIVPTPTVYPHDAVVTVRNDDGGTGRSVGNFRITEPLAPAPTGLTVTGRTHQSITVGWNAVSGAAKLRVRRWVAGTAHAIDLPATSTSVVDASLTPNSLYAYTVVSVNSSGVESAAAGPVSAYTTPLPVTGLTVEFVAGKPLLRWSAPTYGAHDYRLERTGGGIVTFTTTQTEYYDTTANSTGYYEYTVSARNVEGWNGLGVTIEVHVP